MTEIQNNKRYDLEVRTLQYAKNVRLFVAKIKKTISSFEDAKQLIRSSGSVGANYIEANESLSKKDFVLRIKISRKEAKESRFWLELIETGDVGLGKEKQYLIVETTELMKIFGSILEKCK